MRWCGQGHAAGSGKGLRRKCNDRGLERGFGGYYPGYRCDKYCLGVFSMFAELGNENTIERR